jgi:hypothetical protein
VEGGGLSRFLDYALTTWLLPFLGFLAGSAIPLLVALFVGLDGFTFVACILYGLLGTIVGFILHSVLHSLRGQQGK